MLLSCFRHLVVRAYTLAVFRHQEHQQRFAYEQAPTLLARQVHQEEQFLVNGLVGCCVESLHSLNKCALAKMVCCQSFHLCLKLCLLLAKTGFLVKLCL